MQVQNNPWKRTTDNWIRVVQRRGVHRDDDGRVELEFEEVQVNRIVEKSGPIAIYAESQQILEGLKRVHIYAA